jgi:hypothetical protein
MINAKHQRRTIITREAIVGTFESAHMVIHNWSFTLAAVELDAQPR